MHADLQECIAVAKQSRSALLKKEMDVKEANAIATHNHAIIAVHALDLRERMFVAEYQGSAAPLPHLRMIGKPHEETKPRDGMMAAAALDAACPTTGDQPND